MGRQRTQRRGQRQQRERRSVPRQRHQPRQPAKSRSGRSGRTGRTGWAGMRRSRGQKLGIGAVAVVGIALIWIFLDWPLAIGLSALLLLALPAFVVLTMGRRY